jgi:hypothetical protein
MGQQQEMYSYILAGIAIIIVLYFAMRLRRSIQKDRARQSFRERVRPGPALAARRYTVGEGRGPAQMENKHDESINA